MKALSYPSSQVFFFVADGLLIDIYGIVVDVLKRDGEYMYLTLQNPMSVALTFIV